MAQLRDVKTSEVLHEGTPLEVVLIADEIGRDEILFDDVGEGFSPDAVSATQTETIAALEATSNDKSIPKDQRDFAKESLKRERARSDDAKKKVDAVQKTLKKVRGR
jgi:hypothetical protein